MAGATKQIKIVLRVVDMATAELTKTKKQLADLKQNVSILSTGLKGSSFNIGRNVEAFDNFIGQQKAWGATAGEAQKKFFKVNQIAGLYGKSLFKLGRGFSKLSGYLNAFRMEMLGVMFFGMAIWKAFGGLIKDVVKTTNKLTGHQTALGKATIILNHQMTMLKMELGMALVPVIQKLGQWVTSLSNWFRNLTQEQKENIGKWLAIIAVVGLFLFIIGTLVLGISSLVQFIGFIFHAINFLIWAVGGLRGGFILLKGVIMNTVIPALSSLYAFLLANPVILVLAAIIAAVVIFAYAWDNNWGGIRETVNKWANGLIDIYNNSIRPFFVQLNAAGYLLVADWNNNMELMKLGWKAGWISIKLAVGNVWNSILGIIKSAAEGLLSILNAAFGKFVSFPTTIDISGFMANTEAMEKELSQIDLEMSQIEVDKQMNFNRAIAGAEELYKVIEKVDLTTYRFSDTIADLKEKLNKEVPIAIDTSVTANVPQMDANTEAMNNLSMSMEDITSPSDLFAGAGGTSPDLLPPTGTTIGDITVNVNAGEGTGAEQFEALAAEIADKVLEEIEARTGGRGT